MVIKISINKALVFMIQSNIIYVLAMFSVKKVLIPLFLLKSFYVLVMFKRLILLLFLFSKLIINKNKCTRMRIGSDR